MSILERIYFFHAKVQAGQFPNTTSLINEFEVSQATANRDVAYLRDRLLAPLEFNQRKNGFFYTRNNFQLPFEDSPAMTLVLGLLGNLAEETGLAELPELAEIKKRLQGVLFPGRRDISDLLYCQWVERELISGKIFKMVLRALREQKQLQLTYRAGTGRISRRRIEPLKLVNYQGRWYLLAWCRSKKGRRMFHLARMEEADLLDAKVEQSMDKDDNWLQASFGIFKGPVTYRATIKFTGTAAEIIRHQCWHSDQVLVQKKNHILLSLPVADNRELLMKVLQFGAQAEIIHPKRLRAKAKQEIEQMGTRYLT
ncbi:MAG TPA: WYL domain-containing protein [Desulfobulbaceae bacterium]|nr:WYL domain-containing protein [Desulfobulbaceae bacterium]